MTHSKISNSFFLLLPLFIITSSFEKQVVFVKQVVLIDPSWISPTLLRRRGLKFSLFSKSREVWYIVNIVN